MRRALMDRPTRARRVATMRVPAPTEGWDTSEPTAATSPKRASRLDNLFPRSDYVEIRRGAKNHSRILGETAFVETLMPYHGLISARLFAALGGGIYDVTVDQNQTDPVQSGLGSSRIEHVNFANAGGAYLWICNGADEPRVFNGSTWSEMEITGINPASICDVEAYKGRLWLVLEDDTQVAYLGIDAIQGPATTFELGSVMTKGGVVLTVATWSIDGGDGPDDYLVFVTTRGQVIVYGGNDPGDQAGWGLVGVYDIGTPIGRRCVLKMGADLAIVCIDGVKPLSQVMGLDRSLQGRKAITQRIGSAISDAARAYGSNFGWEALTYPRGSQLILNVPVIEGELSHQYVMNTETGAWCRFLGQNASCWTVFQDRLFFGGRAVVMEADVVGSDADAPIVTDWRSSFQYGGSTRTKRFTMAQALMTADEGISVAVGVDTDFNEGRELRPLPSNPVQVSRWGSFTWGRDPWSKPITQRRGWTPIDGVGQCVAVRMRAEIGRRADAALWGRFLWGVGKWSRSEQAETLFQITGMNITFELGDIL